MTIRHVHMFRFWDRITPSISFLIVSFFFVSSVNGLGDVAGGDSPAVKASPPAVFSDPYKYVLDTSQYAHWEAYIIDAGCTADMNNDGHVDIVTNDGDIDLAVTSYDDNAIYIYYDALDTP